MTLNSSHQRRHYLITFLIMHMYASSRHAAGKSLSCTLCQDKYAMGQFPFRCPEWLSFKNRGRTWEIPSTYFVAEYTVWLLPNEVGWSTFLHEYWLTLFTRPRGLNTEAELPARVPDDRFTRSLGTTTISIIAKKRNPQY